MLSYVRHAVLVDKHSLKRHFVSVMLQNSQQQSSFGFRQRQQNLTFSKNLKFLVINLIINLTVTQYLESEILAGTSTVSFAVPWKCCNNAPFSMLMLSDPFRTSRHLCSRCAIASLCCMVVPQKWVRSRNGLRLLWTLQRLCGLFNYKLKMFLFEVNVLW